MKFDERVGTELHGLSLAMTSHIPRGGAMSTLMRSAMLAWCLMVVTLMNVAV
jgi:hypothetical protein